MCVLYVSFWSKVMSRSLGPGSGVDRVQVDLSGFSVRLFVDDQK